MRSEVKWEADGETYYGIYTDYDIYLKSSDWPQPPEGSAYVEEAITGLYHTVLKSSLVDIKSELGADESGLTTFVDEYHKFIDDSFNEALALSDSITGLKPGKLLSSFVGDGRAWYVVTKVSRGRATVEWRGYSPDRYADRILGGGGSFEKKVLEPLLYEKSTIFG